MKLGVVISSLFVMLSVAFAGVDSSISGNVLDTDQAAVSGAKVELLDSSGKLLKETSTNPTGEFSFFPVQFGSYQIVVKSPGFAESHTSLTLASDSSQNVTVNLVAANNKELIINVKEKRNLLASSSSGSKRDISQNDIATLPQGDDISLPKLLATTTPGIIQGPFGQMFIRGNHANVQYQIDGIQLPDSGSGTFGDAFSPRNIDHMEVITGGIPAEYGERMSAVINIVTKSGPEKPGGTAEISFGSYNTVTPQVNFGGSTESGKIHYFGSLSYTQTDRGLDTPEPASYSDQGHGGADAVHDKAHSHQEFVRVDDLVDNDNKFTITAFNSNRFFQIPVYPSSFQSTDPFFQAGYTDTFGNQNQDPTKTTFNYVPSGTNDTQTEQDSYFEFVWKHSFSDSSFLQVAPYVKVSSLNVTNDLNNDLASGPGGTSQITGSQPDSFALDRSTTNLGLKTDFTLRANDSNLIKTGFQVQNSSSNTKNLFIQTSLTATPFVDSGTDTGNLEAVYVQDSYSLTKKLTLNVGLRYSATQFSSSDDVSTSDGLLQPRFEVEYFLFDTTKLHAFYGKLFQPAPFEDLRKAFSEVGGGQLTPYNLQAEKDDFYEVGVTQQVGEQTAISVNYYYKDATNMIDDTQLLNTSIAQPYNFAHGYANGVEFSLTGQLTNNLSEFFNYAYEDARGRGISGGMFAFDPSQYPADQYQFLDHVQLNTANGGVTYAENQMWATFMGLYGSGLRTGPNNSVSLPSHTTFDATAGYKFKNSDWSNGAKVSVDIINLTGDAYPITVSNGFNGSHYAAGREYFVHLGKDF